MTALQELKEYIEDQINKATINNYESASNIANAIVIRNVRIAVNTLTLHKIERLLEIEKQQILDAFEIGYSYGDVDNQFNTDRNIQNLSLGYFKQTYEQEKHKSS